MGTELGVSPPARPPARPPTCLRCGPWNADCGSTSGTRVWRRRANQIGLLIEQRRRVGLTIMVVMMIMISIIADDDDSDHDRADDCDPRW